MISAAHLHLMVNHIPLFGMLFGIMLLVIYFVRQNHRQALLIGLAMILVSGLASVPTFYSGESAEDVVENQANVSEKFIHEHEEAAEVSVWFLAAAGALSLMSLLSIYLKKEAMTKKLYLATLLSSVVAIGLTARTANLGGKISHPELRDSSSAEHEKNKKDDDDD